MPLETDTVVMEERQRPRHAHAVPRGGIASANRRLPDQATIRREIEKLYEEFVYANDSERVPLELAGFTFGNLRAPVRPRGVPRTPELVLAAVAILWERHGSRRELAEMFGCSRALIKKRVYQARERGYLDGTAATDAASSLVAQDGREPAEIVGDWTRPTA